MKNIHNMGWSVGYCSLIPTGSVINTLQLEQNWSSTIGPDIKILKNIQYPHIIPLNAPQSFFLSYGQPNQSITFQYHNTGFGLADIDFHFVLPNCTEVTYGQVEYTYFDGTNTITSNYEAVDPNIIHIPSNEILTITCPITVNGCLDNCTPLNAQFSYKCANEQNMLGVFCQSCENPINLDFPFEMKIVKPQYRLVRTSPLYNNPLFLNGYDQTCSGDQLAWQFKLINGPELIDNTNNSNGPIILRFYNYQNDALTFIENGTVTINTTNSGNIWNKNQIVNNNFGLQCLGGVTDPLSEFTITVDHFEPNSEIIIEFATEKCCTMDNQVNETTLQNNKIYYNHWAVGLEGKDICSNKIATLPPVGPLEEPADIGSGNISIHGAVNGVETYEYFLQTNFNPKNADITVDNGNVYPNTNPVLVSESININNLVSAKNEDFQLLGYNGTSFLVINGILRAHIHCESGLLIDINNTHAPFMPTISFPGQSNVWPAISVGTYAPSTPCLDFTCQKEHDYFYYFDLQTLMGLIGNVDPTTFLNHANFNFTMEGCCPSKGGKTPYTIEFSLYQSNVNCTNACWLPLGVSGASVAVHCPGCLAPGAIVDKYYMRRATFGLTDTDDDRLAEFPTVIYNYSPRLADGTDDYTLLNHSAATYRDRVKDRMVSHFELGDNGSIGYSYHNDMTAKGVFFNTLQLDRIIPKADQYGLTVTGFDFYIDQAVTMVNNTDNINRDDLLFEVYPNNSPTIFEMHVTQTELNTFLVQDPTKDRFLFTFDINQISVTAGLTLATMPNYYEFFDPNNSTAKFFNEFTEGQQYRLIVHYEICNTPIVTDPTTLNTLIANSEIFNNLYFTGTPLTIANIDNLSKAPNSKSELCEVAGLNFGSPCNTSVGYLWNNSLTSSTATGLTAGVYTVTVTNNVDYCGIGTFAVNKISNNCAITITAVVTDINCPNGSSGAIDVSYSGNNGAVSYLWNDGAITEDRTSLTFGIYTIVITDVLGCKAVGQFVVKEPDALHGITAITDVSSPGASDGAVDLTVTGGTSPYIFVWSNLATTKDLINITNAIYTVTVTDANGCTASFGAFVNNPGCDMITNYTSTVAGFNTTACLPTTGTISLTVKCTDATPSYVWSDLSTTPTYTGAPSNCAVTITDGTCTYISNFVIEKQAPKIVSGIVTHETAAFNDGTINVTLDPGTLITQANFANKFKFFCETYGGNFMFLPIVNNHTTIYNSPCNYGSGTFCNPDIIVQAGSSIGLQTTDYFQYEYRLPKFQPTAIVLEQPNTFVGTNPICSLGYRQQFGLQAIVYNAPTTCTVNNTTYTLDQNDLINYFSNNSGFVCADENNFNSQNNSTKFVLDQGYSLYAKLIFEKINCDDNIETFDKADAHVTFDLINSTNLCQTNATTNCGPLTLTYENMLNTNWQIYQWCASKPQVKLTSFSFQTITAATNNVCWDFVIENTTGVASPPLSISIPSTQYFTNWIVNTLPCTTNTYTNFWNTLGLSTYSIHLCADFVACIPPNAVPLTIPCTIKWDCSPPNLSNIPEPCKNELEINLGVTNAPTKVIGNTLPNSGFTICEKNQVECCFRNVDIGDVLPIDITISPLSSYMTNTMAYIDNCNSPGTPIGPFPVNGSAIAITKAHLFALGFTTGYLKSNDELKVTLQFDVPCMFEQEINLPSITLNSAKYCETTASMNTTVNLGKMLLNQTLPSKCTECYSIVKSANPSSAVINQETVTYTITVTSFNGSSQTVSLNDDILGLGTNSNYTGSFPISLNFSGWQAVSTTTYSLTWISPTPIVNIKNTATLSTGLTALQSDTANVLLLTDCDATGIGVIGTNAQSISYMSNAAVAAALSNNTVLIRGTLYLDNPVNNFSFANKTFIMGAGAEIILPEYKILTMKNCTLSACNKMWKGITQTYNANNTGCMLSMTNCIVEDAQYGITLNDYCFGMFQQCTFNNNFVSIYIPVPVSAQVDAMNQNLLIVDNCIFKSTAPLATNYTSQLPAALVKPLAGILINSANFQNCTFNGFDGLSNGIISYRSNLTLRDCWFHNIAPYSNQYSDFTKGFFNVDYNGSGIYCQSGRTFSTLHQTGLGKQGNYSFNNCIYAIFADRMNIESTQNNMIDVVNGYRITAGQNRDIQVYDNTIDTQRDGVQLFFNDGSIRTAIHNNTITFGDAYFGHHAAIRVNEFNGQNQRSVIRHNIISHRAGSPSATSAIVMQSAAQWEVAENIITMVDNVVNKYGLKIDGCLKNNISCNHITGGGQYSNTFGTILQDQAAISTISGDGHTIGCNDINATENGVHVLSDFTFLDIKGNHFNDHTYAYHYGQWGKTPDVDYEGNIWNNQTPMTGGKLAWNENPNYNVAIGPWFDVKTNMLNAYPTITEQQPQGWFQPNLLKNNFNCNDPIPGTNYLTYCDQYPANCSNCKTALDIDIANGEVENGAYSAATLWRMQRALYNKIVDNPALNADSTLNQFYLAQQNTIYPSLKAIDNQIDLLYWQDSATVMFYFNIKQALDGYYTNMSLEYDNLVAAIDLQDQSAIENALEHLRLYKDSAVTLQNMANETAILGDSLRVQSALDITADVAALNAAEDIETNEQQVDYIYLSTIARGDYTFTSLQKSTLRDIASQCPLAGGITVIKARAMVYMFDDTVTYNDRDICDAVGITLKQSQPLKNVVIEKPLIVSLFPNPANENVTIILSNKLDCIADLILTNSLGQIVKSITIPRNHVSYEFSIKGVTEGVYQYNLKCNAITFDKGKLIIVH